MRRADRLFQIVRLLQRKRVTKGAQLAEHLEVSERTIYRDVQDLIASGVAIRGEAGVGYVLDKGFELPPLMFNPEEIEALVLGVRMVEQWSDPALRSSARSILDKVEKVLLARGQPKLQATALFAISEPLPAAMLKHMAALRKATTAQRKVTFAYIDQNMARTKRTVRPLGLYFWGGVWTLAAWCELRDGFRNFRLDRIDKPKLLADHFELAPPVTIDDFVRAMTTDAR
jgi:predicted DNA-binding transcriptional regulator YafY